MADYLIDEQLDIFREQSVRIGSPRKIANAFWMSERGTARHEAMLL
jgi:hypothetical protein